jgi:DNA-binding NarL/FixJ family response regulator
MLSQCLDSSSVIDTVARASTATSPPGAVNDVSSPHAQQQRGFCVERLDKFDDRHDEWREFLIEDRHAGPADTTAARIDFADWLDLLTRRMRRIAELLAIGETTGRVAKRFRLSTGRISQMRRELRDGWDDFQGGAMLA